MGLSRWYLREIEAGRRSEREMRIHLDFVGTRNAGRPLRQPLALRAGEVHFLMKKRVRDWPIADSVIYATAKLRAAQVVSGDPHFKGLADAIFIG